MARVQEAVFENLTPEQQRVYKAIAGPRLTFGGPWNVWIKNPELAETLNKIGDILRVHGKLPKRLQELMILVIARQWDCDYMWFVHEEDAVKQGLTKETVDAIRNYQTPVLVKEDEKVVYAFVKELFTNRCVSQETFDKALAMFGEDVLAEMVTNCGRYNQSAIVVSTYEILAPGGKRPMFDTKKAKGCCS